MKSSVRNIDSTRIRCRVRILAVAVTGVLASAALLSAQTTVPATAPSSRNGNAGKNITTQPGGLLLLNFREANIDSVLDELSSAAGYSIVKTVRPEGRVSLISGQGVTAEGAVQLLNSVLKDKGYVALQQGKILKIDTVEHARHANIPVRTGSDPSKVDPTDELITQVIPLRYANATQLKQDLTPLVNPGADFTANASSNALLITDTAANIRRVMEIVRALDSNLADATEVRVFKLINANATSAAKLVNDLFKTPAPAGGQGNNRGGNNGGGFRGFFGGGGGGFPGFGGGGAGGGGGGGGQGQQGQGNQQSAITSATVNASADDRTNTLVVTGPKDTLATVERVVKQLDDNPEAEETVHIYRLKNANAVDVESTVNALINGTTPNRSSTGSSVNSNRTSLSSGSSLGGSSSLGGGGGGGLGGSSNSGNNRTSVGSFGGQTNSGVNRAGTGSAARTGTAAAAGTSALGIGGQVTVIADVDTNSLLVRCSPKNFDQIKPLLQELDRPVSQVLIQVLIAEVSHENSSDLGAEFSVLNLRASGNGQSGGTQFGIPTGVTGTGFVASILETNFQATLRAYEQNGKLDVLSRPYILASDNQLASVTIGSTTPYVRNSQITEQGTVNNTVQYADIGILLDVIPHINPDGLVTMDVAPTISAQETTSVPISSGVNAPVFSKRSAETHVAVQDGQTIVIGGLMEDRKSETITKVPILGDIPIIGNAFRRVELNKRKTELLIFLTPHVAARADLLQGMGKDELRTTKLVPGAVDAGMFQQHIEGMAAGAPATNPSEPTTQETSP